MLQFILKRTIYSFLIIVGVMLLTFVLFKVSAGDVAAAVLGKNSRAEEVEALRLKLGTDKPLLFGNWQRTEAFDKYQKKINKDVSVSLTFESAKLTFPANFTLTGSDLKIVIEGDGEYSLGNVAKEYYQATNSQSVTQIILDKKEVEKLKKVEIKAKKILPNSINYFRQTRDYFDSQFADSIKEVVSFKNKFPYVSFFYFGETLTTRESIKGIIKQGILPSMCLMIPIFAGEIILGILFALVATAYKGRIVDKTILLLSVASMSISYIVVIIAGQWYLAFYCNFFPVWGFYSLSYLILPIIIGIVSGLGANVRFYRTVFVNELNAEYLRTAKAKGCGEFTIYTHHLLRNAAIPILTRASASLPFLFTGSLLLESYFGIPGLGYIGLRALNDSDLNLLKAIVLLSAFLYVIINLITDIVYAYVDPRIRLK